MYRCSGAVRRGSDEIELTLDGDARRYVFAALRQREQVVDALAKLLATHGMRCQQRQQFGCCLGRFEMNNDRTSFAFNDAVVARAIGKVVGAAVFRGGLNESSSTTSTSTSTTTSDELSDGDWGLLMVGARIETFARGQCVLRQGASRVWFLAHRLKVYCVRSDWLVRQARAARRCIES